MGRSRSRISCELISKYTATTTGEGRETFSQHARKKSGKGKTMADIEKEKVIAVLLD